MACGFHQISTEVFKHYGTSLGLADDSFAPLFCNSDLIGPVPMHALVLCFSNFLNLALFQRPLPATFVMILNVT